MIIQQNTLINVIDNTSTSMGRLLKNHIIKPLTNLKILIED